MPGLTLDKEIEIINENIMKITSEHFEKRYVQKVLKNSKKLKKLRDLSYKLWHEMDRLLEIKWQNKKNTNINTIETLLWNTARWIIMVIICYYVI